jgi:tellurite resistance protein TerC
MEHSIWLWGGFLVVVIGLLAFDLGVLHKKDKELDFKSAAKSVGFYVFLAILFGVFVYFNLGKQQGYEFAMGYLVELSLSADNVFVFSLIFTHFAVPREYRHRVLYWGIIGAIVMRFGFIMAGTTLIKQFDWIIYVFGAFLIYTGIKMVKAAGVEEHDLESNPIVKFAKKNFRITKDYVGHSFFVRQNGVLYMTPLFLVLILIEFSDVVFAVDSIPAIFAITLDPFIVFTSNIFAILGLRSMYFLLENLVERFKYLKYGLSLLLVFIGTKMIVNHIYYPNKIIPTDISLIITLLILVVSVVYSLHKTKGEVKTH